MIVSASNAEYLALASRKKGLDRKNRNLYSETNSAIQIRKQFDC
jgi:hypothetical protein